MLLLLGIDRAVKVVIFLHYELLLLYRCWVKIFRKGEVLVVLVVVSGFDNGANSRLRKQTHMQTV